MAAASSRHRTTRPRFSGTPGPAGGCAHSSGTRTARGLRRSRPMAHESSRPRTTRPPGSGIPRPDASSCGSSATRRPCPRRFFPGWPVHCHGRRKSTACIWDAASGRLLQPLSGHTDRVWSALFSSDSKRVVTASDDRTARLWQVEPRAGSRCFAATRHRSPPRTSRAMGTGSSRPPMTRRRVSGMPPPAARSSASPATRRPSRPPRSRPTVGASSPPRPIGRRASGRLRADASSCASRDIPIRSRPRPFRTTASALPRLRPSGPRVSGMRRRAGSLRS